MKAYLNYFKLRIITNLQYRSAAIAGILTQFFFGFVFIMLYLAIYESNDSSSFPMELSSLITYMWLQQAFFSATYPFLKDNDLLSMISNGNLAYELIRPQNFYLKFYIKMLSERIVAALLRCVPIIIIGFLLPYPYRLGLPASFESFIIFILALSLACLLITAFSLLIHIITLFTIDSRGVISTYSVIAETFMGSIIPLPFFPLWLKKIADVLPFKYISDFPYRVYSGDISVGDGRILLLESSIWIIIVVLFGYIISKCALKKAVIQGG